MGLPRQVLPLIIIAAIGCGPAPDLELGLQALEDGNWTVAFENIEPFAKKGNVTAQVRMGNIYYFGRGVETDYGKAARWYRLAAEQGNTEAQARFGHLLLAGQGVKVDTDEGERFLRLAADQGLQGAQTLLGSYYLDGDHGLRLDPEAGERYLRLAAEQGYFRAQYLLGVELVDRGAEDSIQLGMNLLEESASNGHDEARTKLAFLEYQRANQYAMEGNSVERHEWLKRSAEHGNTQAQVELAKYYFRFKGQGSDPPDYIESARWLQAAAAAGSAEGQLLLGMSYYGGNGVPKDSEECLKWLRSSAAQGFRPAQEFLALLYDDGVIIERDRVRAYAWLNIAASLPDNDGLWDLDPAKNRESIAGEMSRNEIAEAQQLSRDWRPGTDLTSTRPTGVAAGPILVGSGSGFRCNESGDILTNHHVVVGCGTVTVEGENVMIKFADPLNDVALLAGGGPTESFAYFKADQDVELGSVVTAFGFPLSGILGEGMQVTSGVVSSLSGVGNDIRHFQISAPVNVGNSGGPLVDRSGNIVGMVTGRLNEAATIDATGSPTRECGFRNQNIDP